MAVAVIMITIGLYLVMMLVIGFKVSGTNKTVGDYYLGGRKLGPLVTAMSAEASDMSSWLLMGLPGVAYLSGLCDPFWTALGLALGTYANWLIVSKRIRIYSHQLGAITIPDFYAKRYHDDKNVITAIAAAVIVIFFIPYTASGFAACGKLFSSLFDVNYMAAMIVCAAVIVAYTTLGGFLAASTTDLIQSVVMSIALIIVMIYGTVQAGGIGAVADNARSLPGYLSLNHIHDVATNSSQPYSVLTVCSLLAWGLGYFGMPHVLLRFMAIKDKEKLKLSRRIATTWAAISMAIAILIGMIGLAMTNAGKLDRLTNADSEKILIKMAHLLSTHGVLPAIVAGIILAGILAATMSTADSQLLAASSSVSQNLLVDVCHLKVSPKQSVVIARVTVLIISIIAVFLARNPDSSVFKIVSFAWAGFGATFGPITLLALFWKRSNKYGAISGMVVGAAMVFIWKFGISRLGGAWSIYELLPAFVLALIVNVVVSLLTKAPEQSILDEFKASRLSNEQAEE